MRPKEPTTELLGMRGNTGFVKGTMVKTFKNKGKEVLSSISDPLYGSRASDDPY